MEPASRLDGEESWRILFLDAYDSFSNNIVALLKEILPGRVDVYVLHVDLRTPRGDPNADWTEKDFLLRLGSFDAVVCGPGPGSPSCERDVGAFRLLWDLKDVHDIPVLGICLGFQSLVAHFGGRVGRLALGLHGMVRAIEHQGGDIFEGVAPFRATLYHSLCADIGQHAARSWADSKWEPTAKAPCLQPLAWMADEAGEGNDRVLMGVRHRHKPFWGLQYHPESICTDKAAHAVLKNWARMAQEWNMASGRRRHGWLPVLDPTPGNSPKDRLWRSPSGQLSTHGIAQSYAYRQLTIPDGVDAATLVDILGDANEEAVVLDSSSARNKDPLATSSVVALEVDNALRLEYRAKEDYITLRRPNEDATGELYEKLPLDGSSVWDVLTDFWRRRIPQPGPEGFADCIFRGGFMGFVTYEMGLSSILPFPESRERGHQRPDICFAWVQRSVVLDHKAGVAYLQAMGSEPDINAWLDDLVSKLTASELWQGSKAVQTTGLQPPRSHEELLQQVRGVEGRFRVAVPDDSAYDAQVESCQESIRAGESYELCLTAATTMIRPRESFSQSRHSNAKSSWSIFKELRRRQPAPFGSFIRLGGATLISSSPERFLTHDSKGLCSMRPMKGTVRKSEAVSTLAQAEAVLHCPKEEAENLMIVDLVRHDLHGICGPGRVTVPELLKVEEYESLFTMVTVVNGQLPSDKLAQTTASLSSQPFHGLHVLGAALPPGSMTGAPKARSCEILRRLECRERGVYSGVVGYLDVGGRADWSVTIRSMFRWDDERPGDGADEVWRVGAGGAVTILSTPRGETDEMLTKLCGPLGVFWDAA